MLTLSQIVDVNGRTVARGDRVTLDYANPHKTGVADRRFGIVEKSAPSYITILRTDTGEFRSYNKNFISNLLVLS
jgi:hypothetical protein